MGESPDVPAPVDTSTAEPTRRPTGDEPRRRRPTRPQPPDSGPAEPTTEVGTASGEPAKLGPEGPAHFVCFRLGSQRYALPLDHVEQALRMVAVTPVLEAPAWLAGVINLHGRVIPVADLRLRFGHPARTPALSDRLLIVQTPGRRVACIVDEVTAVLEMPAHQVTPPPEPLSRSRPLAAVLRRDEELILVLDAARLLPTEWDGDMQPRAPEETADLETDNFTDIRGIGKAYARKLEAAGVDTFAALADRTVGEVIDLLGLPQGRASRAQAWIDQAAELSRQGDA